MSPSDNGTYTHLVSLVERIGDSIGVLNVGVAKLDEKTTHISRTLGEVMIKVDRMEGQKASRDELRDASSRFERTVADVRAQSKMDVAEFSKQWGEKLDDIVNDLHDIREQVKNIEASRNKLIGSCIIIGLVAGPFFTWIFRLISGSK